MQDGMKEIGQSLVEHANVTAEFSAQRGLTEELFPYIYQASRRMSTRAISAYLQDAHKVKLSAVTIAKALREADKHWCALYDSIEPSASIVAEACELGGAYSVLELSKDEFEAVCSQPPVLAAVDGKHAGEKFFGYKRAAEELREEWFSLDEEIRQTCLSSIPLARDESEEEKEKGK